MRNSAYSFGRRPSLPKQARDLRSQLENMQDQKENIQPNILKQSQTSGYSSIFKRQKQSTQEDSKS